jgi:hypothetical protein
MKNPPIAIERLSCPKSTSFSGDGNDWAMSSYGEALELEEEKLCGPPKLLLLHCSCTWAYRHRKLLYNYQ